MIEEQIEARGVSDERVLAALRATPRKEFVPDGLADAAFYDRPLPIGHGQTISQPYIVAAMTEMLGIEDGDKVLEIGTGSGYQTAILAALGGEVFTIEIVEELGLEARERLERLGYENVRMRIGDGYVGWPEEAPFERIILTASPPKIPDALVEQLAPGGRLVAPEGGVEDTQVLIVIDKDEQGRAIRRSGMRVQFVPMVRGGQE